MAFPISASTLAAIGAVTTVAGVVTGDKNLTMVGGLMTGGSGLVAGAGAAAAAGGWAAMGTGAALSAGAQIAGGALGIVGTLTGNKTMANTGLVLNSLGAVGAQFSASGGVQSATNGGQSVPGASTIPESTTGSGTLQSGGIGGDFGGSLGGQDLVKASAGTAPASSGGMFDSIAKYDKIVGAIAGAYEQHMQTQALVDQKNLDRNQQQQFWQTQQNNANGQFAVPVATVPNATGILGAGMTPRTLPNQQVKLAGF